MTVLMLISASTMKKGEKPIYYLSYKLTTSQTKWLMIEKEAFAIFYALEKLDQY